MKELATAKSPRVQVTVERQMHAVGTREWNDLWKRSDTPTVFARFEWADAWWRNFGAGRELRLFLARKDGRLVGILPTSWPGAGHPRSQPVVLVGDEHSDYAGVLAEPESADVLAALFERACHDLPGGGQLLVRDVRSDTSLAQHLKDCSNSMLASWCLLSNVPCPRSSLDGHRLQAILNKNSLRRHTRSLGREGQVKILHLTAIEDILPRLEAFFRQHVDRWADSRWPSLFLKHSNRAFYRDLVLGLADTGELVFSELSVDGKPAAFHFGFISEGDFVWYKPSFDPHISKLSPGEVLLRELFQFAGARKLSGFDFTRGDEAFKRRFCDQERQALTFVFHASRSAALAARGRAWVRTRLRGPASARGS